MLEPTLIKNDRNAKIWIWTISVLVFSAVAFLANFKLKVNLGFNVHVFASVNAFINSVVSLLLIIGLVAVRQQRYQLHKNIMLTSIYLSVIFLVSYVCHHLLAGDTRFGDIDHNNVVTANEKLLVGKARFVYYFLLITHIPLAAIVLPFVLFTAYRALIGEYEEHKKLVRFTWPLWFYVSISGVLVYLMICPYYS